jgi:hypothetical protein
MLRASIICKEQAQPFLQNLSAGKIKIRRAA